MAKLAAAHLRFPADPICSLPRPIAGLYTFGQPWVGTEDFCRGCDANFGGIYFRYVNNEDIVTRISPRELSYRHAGKVR
jgi:predicted lipase